MDALFVQTAEQNKSQVTRSATAIAPSYRLWPAEEIHQHLIGSIRPKWHRETECMKGLSAACSVCTPHMSLAYPQLNAYDVGCLELSGSN